MALNIPLPKPGEGLNAASEMLSRIMQGRVQKAMAEREQARAKLPFGGSIPSGPAGQAIGLEMVKGLYGEQSPQYAQAKNAFDLSQRAMEARLNYENTLANSAGKRFSTPLGKTALELEDIKKGFMPGTQTPLTPEQKKYYEGKFGLAMLKPTSDADTRKRNLYAKNIDITISKLNPRDLVAYSGLQGKFQLAKDQSKSSLGITNPKYLAYTNAKTAADTLAKQVRQFYGDSITAGIQKGLKNLTDPSSWLKNPEIALQNYYRFVDILKSEMKTYQEATESPDVYSGNSESPVEDELTYNLETGEFE